MPINQNRNNNNKTQIDTNYAHLQPQAVELEKVVLGALMIDTDAFSVVSEMLKPETFYDPRHQKIYEAIQTMNMEERPVDIMTVTDELTKMGAIEKIGGAGYLMEISSQVASAVLHQMQKKVASDSLAYHMSSRKFEEGMLSTFDLHTAAQTLLESRIKELQMQMLLIIKQRLVAYYQGENLIR